MSSSRTKSFRGFLGGGRCRSFVGVLEMGGKTWSVKIELGTIMYTKDKIGMTKPGKINSCKTKQRSLCIKVGCNFLAVCTSKVGCNVDVGSEIYPSCQMPCSSTRVD